GEVRELGPAAVERGRLLTGETLQLVRQGQRRRRARTGEPRRRGRLDRNAGRCQQRPGLALPVGAASGRELADPDLRDAFACRRAALAELPSGFRIVAV